MALAGALATFGSGPIYPFAGAALASAIPVKTFHEVQTDKKIEEKVSTKVLIVNSLVVCLSAMRIQSNMITS